MTTTGDNNNISGRDWALLIVGCTVFLLLLSIVGHADYVDALAQEREYCANVDLYHATVGEQGWPDYNSNYAELCERN